MKRKLWSIVLLGVFVIGAIVYFTVFAQVSTGPLQPITHSVDDVYALLARVETKVDDLASQLNTMSGALEAALRDFYGNDILADRDGMMLFQAGDHPPHYVSPSYLTPPPGTRAVEPGLTEVQLTLWDMVQGIYFGVAGLCGRSLEGSPYSISK